MRLTLELPASYGVPGTLTSVEAYSYAFPSDASWPDMTVHLGKRLGLGSYGAVYEARLEPAPDRGPYAVKINCNDRGVHPSVLESEARKYATLTGQASAFCWLDRLDEPPTLPGLPLASLVAQETCLLGKLSYLQQAIHALHNHHERGMLHGFATLSQAYLVEGHIQWTEHPLAARLGEPLPPVERVDVAIRQYHMLHPERRPNLGPTDRSKEDSIIARPEHDWVTLIHDFGRTLSDADKALPVWATLKEAAKDPIEATAQAIAGLEALDADTPETVLARHRRTGLEATPLIKDALIKQAYRLALPDKSVSELATILRLASIPDAWAFELNQAAVLGKALSENPLLASALSFCRDDWHVLVRHLVPAEVVETLVRALADELRQDHQPALINSLKTEDMATLDRYGAWFDGRDASLHALEIQVWEHLARTTVELIEGLTPPLSEGMRNEARNQLAILPAGRERLQAMVRHLLGVFHELRSELERQSVYFFQRKKDSPLGTRYRWSLSLLPRLPGTNLEVVAKREGWDRRAWLRWFIRALDALHALHEKGWFHGDAQTGNLLIDGEQVYWVDYGMSVPLGSPAYSFSLGSCPNRFDHFFHPALRQLPGQPIFPASSRYFDYFSLYTTFLEYEKGQYPPLRELFEKDCELSYEHLRDCAETVLASLSLSSHHGLFAHRGGGEGGSESKAESDKAPSP